ncbi:hypothetical protein NBH00_05275 [Paraconexibacter antarcticus]|uniref:Terminase n=1 Tax=Paraconexibacter antarcticus TaxID=2949664 RepID=A0ABY5DY85_9ACTN|nr:hypothetical protein [Paraconexibacter antarcticus]UTI65622.1 hypothetical protein NBH00_05275 [Paraconexibacter antarcticus]
MPAAPFEVDYDALLALPEAEQREWYAKIARLKRDLESNPLWGYVPHDGRGTGGQIAYHECSTDGLFIAAAIAGNRWGKTHGGLMDDAIQTLPPEFVPPWLEGYRRKPYNGDYRCRVVVVDLPNALTKVWLPKMRRVIPAGALWKGDFQKAWNERTRMLQFADGSWWDFLTHDMDVDAYAGADVDRIHFDEEPPGAKGRAQFDESLVRLIDRDGDVRFTLTPLLGLNWVYYEITDGGVPRNDEDCRVITGSMDDNPHTAKAMKERLKKKWAKDPLLLEARMNGSFVHFAGSIYPEFSEAEHVVPARPVPRRGEKAKPSVPVYASIDPGLDHPSGVVFAWVDELDVMEVFHAFKIRGTVSDVAKHFHAACERFEVKPRWVVIDPSARNKSHITGRSMQLEYAEHGIHTLPGQNSRLAGFSRVKERLSTGRLLVHAGNEELVEEFRDYRWKARRNQSEDASPEEPIKVKDDMLDALRYLVMSLPVKGRAEADEKLLTGPEQMLQDDLASKWRKRRKRQRIGSK